ncbi:hypothetical protein [Brumimicrobium aurantiacum]|uniref:Outer membrane protein beta-barrel domain-containing protein n=1 Tax=Brumimicrobium aurantiacum TaxID=1737063 RepID=A0A3E1F1A6_9FLAO|nr:hypothetical protein [Brumimicrobium aurantiacum]RFC55611.1 hypothetical protein DXU93_01375 [Brumimicrobium aurantiacum]
MKKSKFILIISVIVITTNAMGQWENLVSNYSFEKATNDFNRNATKLKDDTVPKIKSHGIYLELLGRNGAYSLGYETVGNYGVGLGIGTSVNQHSVPEVKFLNYSFNVSPFYEFGENIGVRVGFNTTFSINPITFTSNLDFLHPADKPPIYRVVPANSLGVYYKTKNQKYQFLVNSYLLYQISIYENRNSSQILPWFGVQFKYNIKNNN